MTSLEAKNTHSFLWRCFSSIRRLSPRTARLLLFSHSPVILLVFGRIKAEVFFSESRWWLWWDVGSSWWSLESVDSSCVPTPTQTAHTVIRKLNNLFTAPSCCDYMLEVTMHVWLWDWKVWRHEEPTFSCSSLKQSSDSVSEKSLCVLIRAEGFARII